ncbi:MAG: gliding motility-associated C-terminal domain-containing protein, partial [Bacteroidota bacterium]
VYLDTLQTQGGCDSVLELSLSVVDTVRTSLSEQICVGSSFAFNGELLTQSGIYLDTLQTQGGCDSVLELSLSVVDTVRTSLSEQICMGSSFAFNGLSLTQSGIYLDTLQTQAGCDSVLELSLNVLDTVRTVLSERVCAGSSFTFNGLSLMQSGVYLDTLQTQGGCDSIIELQLEVTDAKRDSQMVFLCEGESFSFAGTVLEQAGIYRDTLTDDEGCDSIAVVEIVQIEVRSDIQILGAQQISCASPTVVLDGSNSLPFGGVDYEWLSVDDDSLLSSGSMLELNNGAGIRLIVADTLKGCRDTADLLIMQDVEPPEVVLSVADSLDCFTPEVWLDGSQSSAGADYTFEWQGPGLSSRLDTLAVRANSPGWYQLQITDDSNGCSNIDSVQVGGLPEGFEVQLISRMPDCRSAGLIEIGEPLGGLKPFLYSLDGEVFSDIRFWPQLKEGTYNVSVQDASGCEWDSTLVLSAPIRPTLELGNDTTIVLGDSIELIPITNIPSATIDSFLWKPQEPLTCADCFTQWVRPLSTTSYELTYWDENGCPVSDRITIEVDAQAPVFAPNAFTPNGDGINDRFVLYSGPSVAQILVLRIFDRWGELMYESREMPPNDPRMGWDGRLKGEALNPAVFVYYAEILLQDGSKKIIYGDLTLVK